MSNKIVKKKVKRQKYKTKDNFFNFFGNKNKSDDYENPSVTDLRSHIEKLEKKDESKKSTLFKTEFNQMRKFDMMKLDERYVGKNFPTTFLEVNEPKSRYWDVPCTEETRIKLKLNKAQKLHVTDFINANLVGGEALNCKTHFISCQGPLPNTEAAFWFMIKQNNVRIIIMLCNLIEKGKAKCSKYFPDRGETHHFKLCAYDDQYLDVTTTSEYFLPGTNNDVIVRNIAIEDQNKNVSYVTQYHYIAWPDFGIPTSGKSMRMLYKQFIEKMQEIAPSEEERVKCPALVHCSAGIGRTGTFCTISIIIEQLQKFLKDKAEREELERIKKKKKKKKKEKKKKKFLYMMYLEQLEN